MGVIFFISYKVSNPSAINGNLLLPSNLKKSAHVTAHMSAHVLGYAQYVRAPVRACAQTLLVAKEATV